MLYILNTGFALVSRKYINAGNEVDAETKGSRRKTEEKLDGRNKESMNERNLNEGQWEDRKQWSIGVGQYRKNVLNPICTYIPTKTGVLKTMQQDSCNLLKKGKIYKNLRKNFICFSH